MYYNGLLLLLYPLSIMILGKPLRLTVDGDALGLDWGFGEVSVVCFMTVGQL